MRLLLVTQDFPPDIGGIQTYSWKLAHRLAEKASVLEVIAPNRPGAITVDREASFPITRVSGRPDLLPFTAAPAVLRRARAIHADITLHAQWQTVGLSLFSRWKSGWPRRIVSAAHGRELLFNPLSSLPVFRNVYDGLRRWLLRRVDTFVPVSHFTAELLHDQGVPSSRTHVVPNGTDPEHFSPQSNPSIRKSLGLSDEPMLLTVGRLVRRKGVDTVMRALSKILQTHPDVAFVVVGTGPDESRLKKLSAELNLQGHVHFVGSVSQEALPSYYSEADLFVMPACGDPPDVEGFGIVFLEANACGTPVIGARSGGIPDAIREGETGLLVPPSSPDALTEAVLQVLTQPSFAEELSQNGRKHIVEEANWDRVADSLYEYLSTLT